MQITSIGIDLGKTNFHLVILGEQSKVLVRKKFSRKQLLAFTANLPGALTVTNGMLLLQDTNAPNVPYQYYRIIESW